MYILKAWIKSTWYWYPLPKVSNNAAWLAVSPEIGPQFPGHGAGSSPDFRQNPSTGNRCPIGAARGRNRACNLSVASLCASSPRSRPDQIQNPKSKLQTGRLDFGFWILAFGFWSLDFGFWINLVFVLYFPAPNGPVRISDFGFRILDFGLLGDVWVLHKIFVRHADSGRRIQYIYIYIHI